MDTPNPPLETHRSNSFGTFLPRTPREPVEYPPDPDWCQLVQRLKQGDHEAMEELYRVFYKGIRFHFCRHLGQRELDDKVHDTFLIVVEAIKRGELREPERLMGFVRTIVRRQVAAYIDEAVHERRETAPLDHTLSLISEGTNPEDCTLGNQRIDLMVKVLRALSRRDREILTRFYLQEQSQEQICRDMKLSETQFRLLKSRAKARFGALGRKKLQGRQTAPTIFVRTIAGLQH